MGDKMADKALELPWCEVLKFIRLMDDVGVVEQDMMLGRVMCASNLLAAAARDNVLWYSRAVEIFGADGLDSVEQLDSFPRVREGWTRWRAAMKDVPIPTPQQVRNYVRYVCAAHSWYKHLPIVAGTSISLYLSPTSCMKQVRHNDGTRVFEPYVPGDGTQFHYNWTPTDEYRKHYGHLSYNLRHRRESDGDEIRVLGLDGQLIPNMIPLRATPVTAVMHEMSIESGHGNLYDSLVAEIWQTEQGREEVPASQTPASLHCHLHSYFFSQNFPCLWLRRRLRRRSPSALGWRPLPRAKRDWSRPRCTRG